MVVFATILSLIFFSAIGGIILWLYKLLGGPEAKTINWNGNVTYPKYFAVAAAIILIGYHIGLHSYLFVFGPDMRFAALGWAIFSVLMACAWLALLWKRQNFIVWSAVIIIAVSGVSMVLRANGFVQSFNLGVQLLSMLILTIMLIHETITWTLGTAIRTLAAALPQGIIHFIQIARSLFRRDAEKQQQLGGWIKTIVITIGVLVFFIYILSQADPVFSQIIKEFRDQLFGRTFATIIILFILASLFSIQLNGKQNVTGGWITFRDIVTAVTAVVAIIAVFLFVQYKYLFLGSRELLIELNLTFSEYVRRGFTELLLAVFIGGFLSYLTTLKLRSHTDVKQIQWARVVNIVLILELFFLLLSALRRDLLYVETYGLTRVRVVGGVFLFWLFGFLLLLAFFELRKNMREAKIMFGLWLMSCIVWLLLNTMNIDKMVIAGAPKHHEYTDYFYLSQLSEDPIDEKIALIPQMETEINTLLQKEKLTDIERNQLAGIKLALVTFIEKRDRLYRYYAPQDWLLQNGWRIGNQFEKDYIQNGYGQDNINESIYAIGWKDSKKKRALDEILIKQRKFAYYNQSEQRAYNTLASNTHAYFDPINDLLKRIRTYQIEKQISLLKEENRLLHEFQYPFLSVTLRRYYPEQLNRIYISNDPASNLNMKVFMQLEKNQPLNVTQLRTAQCGQLVEPVEVYGVMSNYTSSITATTQITNLESINALGEGAVVVQVPAGVKIQNSFDDTSVVTRDGSMQIIENKPSAYYTQSDRIAVKALLSPVAIQAGGYCKVEFEAKELTEIKGL